MLLLLSCAVESEAPVLVDTVPYLDGEVLVAVAGDEVSAMHLEDDNDLVQVDRIDAIGVSRFRFDETYTVRGVVEKLERDDRVLYVEANTLVRIAGADDPYLGYQWNLDAANVTPAWQTTTGKGVTVAVLDTGVRTGGPDGIATLLSGYDFYNNDDNPSDGNGHGTFVAGTIAQSTNNAVGVAGIAPGVDILPVKVMGDDGTGDVAAIANGLVWAADQGAQVANMSLGSAYPSQTLEDACRYARDRGVTLVGATGNEYGTSVGYPAAYDTVIAVGATGYSGVRAGYSNTGKGIDLMAPGGDLSKDENKDGYADGILQETIENGRWTYTFWEGTSMATPHVAAAAALVTAAGASNPDEVYAALTSTARDLGSTGYDTSYGYGLLDVTSAVAVAGSAESGSDGSGSSGSDTGGGGSSGVDTTPPTLSNVSGFTQGNKFTLQWTTNEPATSAVNFEGYGEIGDETLTTSHALSFNGNAGDTYYFTLVSRDAATNRGETGTYYVAL